jgi:RNA polymerase sigma-70 factor, ECF subfamily
MSSFAAMRCESAAVDEGSLIDLAQNDPQHFAALYDAHFERIYVYVLRRVRNQATAEDVTADVFTKALKALPRYRQTGRPFAAWLYRIASNTLSDHGRRVYLYEAVEGLDDVADGLSLEDQVVHRDEIDRIWCLVDLLSTDQREAVELKFREELSIVEIAAVMDRTPGAVKLLIHRGLARLRRHVDRSRLDF